MNVIKVRRRNNHANPFKTSMSRHSKYSGTSPRATLDRGTRDCGVNTDLPMPHNSVRLPNREAPSPLRKLKCPRAGDIALDREPPHPKEVMFKLPKAWRELVKPPPRNVPDEERPLREPEEPSCRRDTDTEPPKMAQAMARPAPRHRPKKVSPIEPAGLDPSCYLNKDRLPTKRDKKMDKLPQPDPLLVSPNFPGPPRMKRRTKNVIQVEPPKLQKRQSSRIVKVTTERVETKNSDSSCDSEQEVKSTKKANHLPPPEILFAHVGRVEKMREKIEPTLSEMNRSPRLGRSPTGAQEHSLRKQATFKS